MDEIYTQLLKDDAKDLKQTQDSLISSTILTSVLLAWNHCLQVIYSYKQPKLKIPYTCQFYAAAIQNDTRNISVLRCTQYST